MARELNRKPDYQLWSEEEFSSDLYVRAMTPIQRWMYRTLLQAAFFHSTRPYLPDEDSLLWMLAGCESRSQWDSNREAVRAMFQSVNIDGKQLLSQKRVVADWGRLQDKREAMSEGGRRGVQARLEGSLNQASTNLGEVREGKVRLGEVSEGKVSEEPRSFAKDENVPALVQQLAAELLQYTKRLTPEEKKDLTLLGRAFPGRVSDDFAAWAESEGSSKAYPVAFYLRVANERLRDGVAAVSRFERDPNLQPLLVEVAAISGYTPSGKSQTSAANLLKTYTVDEIINAFKEHVSNLDDFGLKRSIQTFFEGGGGEVVIALRRKRAADKQAEEELKARQREQMRAESEADTERIEAEQEKSQEEWDSIFAPEPSPSTQAAAPEATGLEETLPQSEDVPTPPGANYSDLNDIPF